jgi:hypothetical protein
MKLHSEHLSESQFDLTGLDSISVHPALGYESGTLGCGTKFNTQFEITF